MNCSIKIAVLFLFNVFLQDLRKIENFVRLKMGAVPLMEFELILGIRLQFRCVNPRS